MGLSMVPCGIQYLKGGINTIWHLFWIAYTVRVFNNFPLGSGTHLISFRTKHFHLDNALNGPMGLLTQVSLMEVCITTYSGTLWSVFSACWKMQAAILDLWGEDLSLRHISLQDSSRFYQQLGLKSMTFL